MSPGGPGAEPMLPDAGAGPGYPRSPGRRRGRSLHSSGGPWAANPVRAATVSRMGSHRRPRPRRRQALLGTVAAASALALAALTPAYGWVAGRTAPEPRQGVATRAYVLPTDEAVVLSVFHGPAVTWGPGHRGVDLAAATGSTVRSPADGVIAFTGRVVDRDVVSVVHDDGRRSSIEPVLSEVAVGTAVRAGDPLGTVQAGTHCGATSCVHWGVREGQRYVDPLGLLAGGGPTVLLPTRDE